MSWQFLRDCFRRESCRRRYWQVRPKSNRLARRLPRRSTDITRTSIRPMHGGTRRGAIRNAALRSPLCRRSPGGWRHHRLLLPSARASRWDCWSPCVVDRRTSLARDLGGPRTEPVGRLRRPADSLAAIAACEHAGRPRSKSSRSFHDTNAVTRRARITRTAADDGRKGLSLCKS
jgi:hypothetical protein